MDDIDRDIQRSQIGKKSESLVNPYPKKEKNTSNYVMPPMDVNFHKYKNLFRPYHESTRDKTSTKKGSGTGWWIVGLLVVIAIITKIVGLW
jgi:hypothetical protein